MPKAELPANFNAEHYIELMSPVIGLALTDETIKEVAKLLNMAHSMAEVVYQAPVDDNAFDLANVFSAGKKHD